MPLNAGFGLYGPIEDIGIDEARYQFDVNVFGPGIRARFERVTQRFRMAASGAQPHRWLRSMPVLRKYRDPNGEDSRLHNCRRWRGQEMTWIG
jgi:hypothetical protein